MAGSWVSNHTIAKQGTSMRLLVIDKQLRDLTGLSELLGPNPPRWSITKCSNLNEGLRELSAAPFDSILIDPAPSDGDVLSNLEALRRAAVDVPVIIWTDRADLTPHALCMDGVRYLVGRRQLNWALLEQFVASARCSSRFRSQLEASERQLQVLAGQLPAMLWTTDEQLRFTSMRGRELSLLGLNPEKIVGSTVESLFAHSRAAGATRELHRRALLGESTSAEVEWHRRCYHTHVEPLRNAQGEIAGTIGVALNVTEEQKLRRDIHAAHQVQEHLLPAHAPQLEGFDIAGRCYPAEDCSGDFFDFIPLPARRLAIVLADVSGHGFGPAILAAAIRSYLRMAAVLGNQVHEMLALANRLLLSDGELTPFASVFAASLDPESQTIRYASAGHPAYLIHFDSRTTRLESLALPIGIRNDQMFTLSTRIKLKPGDIFLLASDGLFEAGSATGEQFGVNRAIAVVRENMHEDAKAIVEKLHEAAEKFTNNASPDDDQTIVVVRFAPATGSLRETWTA